MGATLHSCVRDYGRFLHHLVRLPGSATDLKANISRHVLGIISGAPGHSGPKGDYFSEWNRFLHEFVRGSYVYNTGAGLGAGNYNTTTWSITAEFRGSTIIYVLQLAFFSLQWSPTKRFWSCLGGFFYLLCVVDAPYFSLFVMGILLCDLDLTAELDPYHLPNFLSHFKFMSKYRWLYYIPLFAGLYLGSAPHVERIADLAMEPGWSFFAMLIPSTVRNARWFLAVWAAVFAIIAIPRITWLRRFFEAGFCQYLGKISFGFYLVHGPVIWTIGDRVLAAVGRPHQGAEERIPSWVNLFPLSDYGPLGLEVNAVLPHLIILPAALYFAGVVTKLFDEPSVTLSKWLFKLPAPKVG